MSHADTIRDNITCVERYDSEKGWHRGPTNLEALAAVDAWEAETKQLKAALEDELQWDFGGPGAKKVERLEAEVQRLRDALEQIASHPNLAAGVFARAALAEEADRG